MKARKNVKAYSALIAKKYSLPEKEVRASLIQFCKNIAEKIKKGEDIRLDGYFTILTNKESRLKFFNNKNNKTKKNGNTH